MIKIYLNGLEGEYNLRPREEFHFSLPCNDFTAGDRVIYPSGARGTFFGFVTSYIGSMPCIEYLAKKDGMTNLQNWAGHFLEKDPPHKFISPIQEYKPRVVHYSGGNGQI